MFCVHPHYSIQLAYFLMAIKISAGVSLPLGPLFLGHLLTRLDELHGDEIMGELVMWSLHRRTVPSFRLSCRNVVLNTCPSARSSATLNVTSRTVLLRLLRIVANSLIRFLSSIVGLVWKALGITSSEPKNLIIKIIAFFLITKKMWIYIL